MKKKYDVYMRRILEAEDEENNVVHPWEYVQTTWATSEDKAINNARYNLIGKASQYLPVVVSGHWEYWLEWKALERKNRDGENETVKHL